MAEEIKTIRLNKAAKEFNVGIQNLVDFLAKKGHQVDLNPNTRISPEQYELLAAEFQSEREVKENADKIEINTTTNTVVIEANTPSEESKKVEAEEVIIKNVFTAPIMEPVKEKEPEPVKEEIPVVASDSVEEQPEPEPEETKEVETEPEVAEAAEEPAEEKNGNVLSEPRIIGKIDLDAINSKTSPGKKSKNQKNAKKTAKAANNNATPNAAEAANQKAKKVEPKPEPTPKVEEKPAERISENKRSGGKRNNAHTI